jgi:hypothetical protein
MVLDSSSVQRTSSTRRANDPPGLSTATRASCRLSSWHQPAANRRPNTILTSREYGPITPYPTFRHLREYYPSDMDWGPDGPTAAGRYRRSDRPSHRLLRSREHGQFEGLELMGDEHTPIQVMPRIQHRSSLEAQTAYPAGLVREDVVGLPTPCTTIGWRPWKSARVARGICDFCLPEASSRCWMR